MRAASRNVPHSADIPRNEYYEIERFQKHFAAKVVEVNKLEDSGENERAADMHAALAYYTVKSLDHIQSFDNNDRALLRAQVTRHYGMSLLLRGVALNGFGEAMMTLASVNRMNKDITEKIRSLGNESDENSDLAAETADPRTHTNGLYEYMPYDAGQSTTADLPGYEEQHQRIVNAYYVLEDTSGGDGGNGNGEANLKASITHDREGGGGDATSLRSRMSRSGANIVLYGPPGTGKTVAARAVANFLQLDFVFVNSENLSSAYRSETEKNLRKLYVKMRALVRLTGRNVVLLLDEVDGLVKNRSGGGDVSSTDYSLLTKFLTILEPNDGSDNYGIMSIFTTNRLDNLDDAFLRRCTQIFFGQIVLDEARLRVLSHFCSDSMQIDVMRDDKATLETRYRVDGMIARDSDIDEMLRLAVDWVPGDYARFLREVVRPLRLREYLRQRGGITESQFYSQISASMRRGDGSGSGTTTAGSNGNRTITVNLPKLSMEQLVRAMRDFRPTTPMAQYVEQFPLESEREREARARELRL